MIAEHLHSGLQQSRMLLLIQFGMFFIRAHQSIENAHGLIPFSFLFASLNCCDQADFNDRASSFSVLSGMISRSTTSCSDI